VSQLGSLDFTQQSAGKPHAPCWKLLCIALPLHAAGLSQFYRPGRNFHSLVGSAFYVVSDCVVLAAICVALV